MIPGSSAGLGSSSSTRSSGSVITGPGANYVAPKKGTITGSLPSLALIPFPICVL